MTTRSAAELRRWWREGDVIWGHVYNDPLENWKDGELGSFDIIDITPSVNFYVLKTRGVTLFKLDKDEEDKRKSKEDSDEN